MKKIAFLISMLLLTGCRSNTPVPTTEPTTTPEPTPEITETVADMQGYGLLEDKDHVYRLTSVGEMIERAEHGDTFAVYFGYDTCPWCNEAVPILNDAAKAAGVTVGYVNIYPHDGEPEFDYDRLIEVYGDQFPKDEDGEHKVTVPFVFFFRDGELVLKYEGTVSGHNANERRMTAEEKERLFHSYEEGFTLMTK